MRLGRGPIGPKILVVDIGIRRNREAAPQRINHVRTVSNQLRTGVPAVVEHCCRRRHFRDGGTIECAGRISHYTGGYREFESTSLRHAVFSVAAPIPIQHRKAGDEQFASPLKDLMVNGGPKLHQSLDFVSLENGYAIAVLPTPNGIRVSEHIVIPSFPAQEAITQRVADQLDSV